MLDSETYEKLDPPSEAELDMLDLAYEPTETSRLGCQIHMEEKLDGMTITLPSDKNDLWQ
jgi:ferredoxin